MAESKVISDVTGLVWKILVAEGDKVMEDMPLAMLESMKMEIPVLSPADGVVSRLFLKEGDRINEGDVLATIET